MGCFPTFKIKGGGDPVDCHPCFNQNTWIMMISDHIALGACKTQSTGGGGSFNLHGLIILPGLRVCALIGLIERSSLTLVVLPDKCINTI